MVIRQCATSCWNMLIEKALCRCVKDEYGAQYVMIRAWKLSDAKECSVQTTGDITCNG